MRVRPTQADRDAANEMATAMLCHPDFVAFAFAEHRIASQAELVKAATALASDVQEILDGREWCGEWGVECPLQDAGKPGSTVERLQGLLDVLARIDGESA